MPVVLENACGLVGTIDDNQLLFQLVLAALNKMSQLSDYETMLPPCLEVGHSRKRICHATNASKLYQLLVAQKASAKVRQKPQDLLRLLFDTFSAATTASAVATNRGMGAASNNVPNKAANDPNSNRVKAIQNIRRDLTNLKSKAEALTGLDQFCVALDNADPLLDGTRLSCKNMIKGSGRGTRPLAVSPSSKTL
jgi:hypothetical protein